MLTRIPTFKIYEFKGESFKYKQITDRWIQLIHEVIFLLNSYIYFIYIPCLSYKKQSHLIKNGVSQNAVSTQTWCTSRNFGTRASCLRVQGLLPLHIFKLLMLAAKSFVQINQVNSILVLHQKIIMRVNELCGVTSGNKPKTSIFDSSLCAFIASQAKERCICWTRYAKSHSTTLNYHCQVCLLQSHCIAALAFWGVTPHDSVPIHWQLLLSMTVEERKRLCFKFLRHVLNTRSRFGCEE